MTMKAVCNQFCDAISKEHVNIVLEAIQSCMIT